MLYEVITEEGIVASVKDEITEVQIISHSECCSCSAKAVCSPNKIVHTSNKINAKVGDKVQIKISGDSLLKTSMILYGLPLFFLISGILIGTYLFRNYSSYELISVVLGFVITLLYYLAIFNHNKKHPNTLPNIEFIIIKNN